MKSSKVEEHGDASLPARSFNALPARPRRLAGSPSYPRALAAIAVVASLSVGCKKDPEVQLAGEPPAAFDAGTKTTSTTPTTGSPANSGLDGVGDVGEPVMLGGVAPHPYEPVVPEKKK